MRDNNLKDLGGVIEACVFIFGFFALASIIMAIIAFSRPVLAEVADNVDFKQQGTFSYNTTAPIGVYDLTRVSTGDPLFPKLTCVMNLQFAYSFIGNLPEALAGTHLVTAVIQDNVSGWKRTLPLETETGFTGSTFVSNTSLDICEVEAIVAAMEDTTDLHQSSYSLIVNPHVAITGTMSERVLQAAFEPQLNFLFDKVHFYINKSDPTKDPFNPSQDGMIAGTHIQANTISLLGIKLDVSKTRVISLGFIAFSMGGLLILAIYIARKVRGEPGSPCPGEIWVHVGGCQREAHRNVTSFHRCTNHG